MSDKFSYSYSAPTAEERRELEGIRKQYQPCDGKGAEVDIAKAEAQKRLQALHRRVGEMPKAITIVIAIVGTLIFGTGMSLALVWENYWFGVPVGVVGIVILCLVAFIYRALLKRNRKKYGAQIVALCDRLLNEEK